MLCLLLFPWACLPVGFLVYFKPSMLMYAYSAALFFIRLFTFKVPWLSGEICEVLHSLKLYFLLFSIKSWKVFNLVLQNFKSIQCFTFQIFLNSPESLKILNVE